jgi:hypothetical protein
VYLSYAFRETKCKAKLVSKFWAVVVVEEQPLKTDRCSYRLGLDLKDKRDRALARQIFPPHTRKDAKYLLLGLMQKLGKRLDPPPGPRIDIVPRCGWCDHGIVAMILLDIGDIILREHGEHALVVGWVDLFEMCVPRVIQKLQGLGHLARVPLSQTQRCILIESKSPRRLVCLKMHQMLWRNAQLRCETTELHLLLQAGIAILERLQNSLDALFIAQRPPKESRQRRAGPIP